MQNDSASPTRMMGMAERTHSNMTLMMYDELVVTVSMSILPGSLQPGQVRCAAQCHADGQVPGDHQHQVQGSVAGLRSGHCSDLLRSACNVSQSINQCFYFINVTGFRQGHCSDRLRSGSNVSQSVFYCTSVHSQVMLDKKKKKKKKKRKKYIQEPVKY